MPTEPSLEDLRRYAVARSLFTPTTLPAAIQRLGFVQADPIRAPARAQDLTLRHRVKDYRAGDLERRYPRLAIDEDCLVNYGFLPREHLALMHPRRARKAWDAETERKATDVLAFVRERGAVHPREVEQHFAHGRVQNYWGGASNASTQLLDGMHYRGLLRVQRRDSGTRAYEAVTHPPTDDGPAASARRAAALIDLVVRKYAPLPAASLTYLVRLLAYGAPHLAEQTQAALRLAREHLASCRIDGTTWYWPSDENPRSRRHAIDGRLRLLAPFDPVVWDRRRFTLLWDWTYRFEAYTPPAQRQFGYYALPMLWQGHVIGWANVTAREGRPEPAFGYVAGAAPQDAAFRNALDEEVMRMQQFLVPRRDGTLPAPACHVTCPSVPETSPMAPAPIPPGR
ncbi:Uncharacterized protein conserved in bacteria [Delftia tsuruhatensis]|uniref:DNA glycosylase AlkZ-like family protein n=1 Tax=Delftia tsuruhatensis TaxID=180282 RepID=UPI001E6AB563|nr:crosslink repair DNA glycosylase YcaQ family protein [Delftia tsuruhatensis]CAB5714816.1 Uncharacterized protein conserved in bacteria [Delftia tsuruhatensis]CAC9689235.1 Uncharacterized protein conserved in bacteria [Delftia tsuruhatensis]